LLSNSTELPKSAVAIERPSFFLPRRCPRRRQTQARLLERVGAVRPWVVVLFQADLRVELQQQQPATCIVCAREKYFRLYKKVELSIQDLGTLLEPAVGCTQLSIRLSRSSRSAFRRREHFLRKETL